MTVATGSTVTGTQSPADELSPSYTVVLTATAHDPCTNAGANPADYVGPLADISPPADTGRPRCGAAVTRGGQHQ